MLNEAEEQALSLFEELGKTNVNTANLNVDCCCGLMKTSPFHQPKKRCSPTPKRITRAESISRNNERFENIKSIENSLMNSFHLHNNRRKVLVYDTSSGETSCSSTTSSHLEDISDKISELNQLDTNIHSLWYKSVEVHADILSLEAQTSRLLADTRKLSEDLDDVKYLDDLIDMLNSDIGPVIHREWPYRILFDTPIEEGTAVTYS